MLDMDDEEEFKHPWMHHPTERDWLVAVLAALLVILALSLLAMFT